MLTLEQAAALNRGMITQENLQLHVKNVSYAMAALARHFGGDPEHWQDTFQVMSCLSGIWILQHGLLIYIGTAVKITRLYQERIIIFWPEPPIL